MDPLRLYLENFCSHSNTELDLTNLSATIITGRIKDNEKHSNGSGKSTLFAAIKYVLFNKIDFSTLDRIINYNADFCRVGLDFRASDNEIYRIVRSKSRKVGSEVRLYKLSGDKWEDATQRRMADTEKEIDKLIRINYQAFVNSVLFTQSDISSLTSITSEKRKSLLKDIFQLNIYSKLENIAKKQGSDIDKEIEKNNTLISILSNPQDRLVKIKNDYEIINKNINDIFLDKEKQEKNVKSYTDTLSKINVDIENIKNINITSAENEKKINQEIYDLKLSLADLQKKLNYSLTLGKNMTSELSLLKKDEDSYKNTKYREEKSISNDIDSINARIMDVQSSIKSIKYQIEEKLIPLPEGGFCKSCRQKMTKEHIENCKIDIERELIELNKKLMFNRNEYNTLHEKYKKLTNELSFSQSTKQNIQNITSSINVKNNEIENTRKIYKEYKSFYDKSKQQLENKNNELEKIKNISTKEKLLFFENEHRNISLSLEIEQNRLNKINSQYVDLISKKAVFEHNLEQCNIDVNKFNSITKEIKELEGKNIINQKVIQAFSAKGIPNFIIFNLIDDLEIEVNEILCKLYPDIQLEFILQKEDKEQEVIDMNFFIHGKENEFLQLSAAQKLIVNFSLKIAILNILKKRLGISMKFLLLDEIDQSLDQANIENFVNIVKEMQKEYKIFIITHNNELNNRFNSCIRVEQNEGISTAKVINN